MTLLRWLRRRLRALASRLRPGSDEGDRLHWCAACGYGPSTLAGVRVHQGLSEDCDSALSSRERERVRQEIQRRARRTSASVEVVGR